MERRQALYKLLRKQRRDGDRFEVSDAGCGMEIYREQFDGVRVPSYLVNTRTRHAYSIVSPGLTLMAFSPDDILWDEVDRLENSDNARLLLASYGLSVHRFENRVAYVEWTLCPDGRYFMDEDGFGMRPQQATVIGAYIDTECRVLVKFQDMRDADKRARLRAQAERLATRMRLPD